MRTLPFRALRATGVILALCVQCSPAQDTQTKVTEAQRKRVAVTLNYCRASLSRIRRYPSKRVLIEEQERILNNLDLNAIRDEEVINLYSAVLDEINQAQILETERRVINERTRRNMQRKLGADLFVIGAHVATGQLGNAIQSGANSWWDYRNTTIDRDSQAWAIERTRINGIVDRSSRFLDAAWKLSRRNEIPDQWLVRTADLVALQKTMREPNQEVRLRVLKRMARFMQCYPPYWYYVARTEQQLGRLKDAARTYRRLAELGDGHFRKDDMLAAGTANLAMIEEYLGDTSARRTAEKALEYSTDSWEVNLTCAWVLNRHSEHTSAEDAILRNLDVDLEQNQSSIALVSLYYHTKNEQKLAKILENKAIVARVPIPGLLLAATLLESDRFPTPARHRIASSLRATTETRFGREAVVLRTTPDWKLADARIAMVSGEKNIPAPRVHSSPRGIEIRFPLTKSVQEQDYVVKLNYPQTPEIQLQFAAGKPRSRSALGIDLGSSSPTAHKLASVSVGKKRLSMVTPANVRQ